MKRLCYSFMVCMLVLLATGCDRQQTYDRVLAEVDSLVEHQADSACRILEGIADVMEQGDEASRACYTILLTQAKYKCYELGPSDSLVNAAVRYYEQTDDQRFLCRAWYYRAMTLYEQRNHEDALLLLKKGEALAVRIHDIRYMAKYHESLCMMNDRARCYDLMLKYAEQTFSDAIRLKDTATIARSLSYVSIAYYRLGQRERARDRIRESLSHITDMDDEGKAYILTNMGSMSYQFGDIDAAEKYLSESLKLYPMPHTYAELGNVYADMGKIQEAERYWQEALKTDDAQTILNVLPSMQERYEQQQDYRSALAMSERIHQIKDSLTQTSEQATLAEIQHRYDRQVVESKYYKVLAWLFGSILLLVALSLGSLYVYRRTVRKYTSQLSAKEEIIRDAQRKIALLSNMDGEHSEEITALQKQITTLQKQTNEQLGQGMDIYNKIANGGKLSSTDNEQYLIEYYSVLRYETYSTWMKEYKDLSARLITFLILTDMGKSNSEIEEILSITYSSLRSIKTRIKAKHRHSK